MKKRMLLILAGLLPLSLLTGCGALLDAPLGTPASENVQEASLEAQESAYMTALDLTTEEGTYTSVDLTLLADAESIEAGVSAGAASSAEGLSWDGSELVISAPGAYALSGNLRGSIVVRTDPDETVHLILNNVTVRSDHVPAVYAEQAGKLILTAAPGTENTFSDSSHIRRTQENACIFSQCDLTLNGGGKFLVYGFHRDAVRSKDVLKACGTDLYVRAKQDGLRGNDGVFLRNVLLEAECEENGIRTDSDKDFVILEGCGISIIAGQYGIRTRGDIHSEGTSLQISSVLEPCQAGGSVTGLAESEGE